MDDTLNAGDGRFEKLTEKTAERFQCRKKELDNIQFAGIEIEKSRDGFLVHQKQYLKKIKPIPKGSDFSAFRSTRAKLFWICQTRPDISCAVATLAQVTELQFEEERDKHTKKLNSVITHLENFPDFMLRFPKLDKDSLSISVYSDASFCNNQDGSSQLGYIILLKDK